MNFSWLKDFGNLVRSSLIRSGDGGGFWNVSDSPMKVL